MLLVLPDYNYVALDFAASVCYPVFLYSTHFNLLGILRCNVGMGVANNIQWFDFIFCVVFVYLETVCPFAYTLSQVVGFKY